MVRALRDLDDGSAAVLIVASLSRLGRSTRDVLDLAASADANGWALAILDLNLDTATPTGRFTLTMLAAVAQLERDQTSERTTAALAAKKAQGHRLGRPASEATRAAGARALDLRADGLTWRAVAQALTDEGYTTRGGGPWHPPHSTTRSPHRRPRRRRRQTPSTRDGPDMTAHGLPATARRRGRRRSFPAIRCSRGGHAWQGFLSKARLHRRSTTERRIGAVPYHDLDLGGRGVVGGDCPQHRVGSGGWGHR